MLLYPRRTFHLQTGAPHWADGAYTADGAIHAAIGGVARVEPDLERRLAHELAHAFIANLSADLAPRWLQEGLAQALSDPRPGSRPSPVEAMAVEDLDYRGTLDFTRSLLAEHGPEALRDALASMGDGASVEEAFRRYLGVPVVDLFATWRASSLTPAATATLENAP